MFPNELKKNLWLRFLLIFLVLQFSVFSLGNEKINFRGFFYLGVPVSKIKSDVASREGIGTSKFGLELGSGILYNGIMSLGMDIGFEEYEDKKKFTQLTTAGSLESNLTIPYFSIIAGLKTPPFFPFKTPGFGIGLDLFGGYTKIIFAGRFIGNCADCYEEDINVSAGFFLEPCIELFYDSKNNEKNSTKSERYGFSFSYRRYLMNSDFERRYIL